MRGGLLALAAALAWTAPAAQADGDPFLVYCIANTEVLIEQAIRDAEDTGEERFVNLAANLRPFQQAFWHRLGEDDGCTTPFETLRDEIAAERTSTRDAMDQRVADGEPIEVVLPSIFGNVLRCEDRIGEAAMAETLAAIEADGMACGWEVSE